MAPLDGATRAMLRRARRRPVPRDRRRVTVATVVVLALHVFFLAALWHEMRPEPPRAEFVHVSLDRALQVRFVPRGSTTPPPPAMRAPAALRPTEPARPKPAREAVRKDAMVVHMDTPAGPAPATSAVSAPRLYDREGAALLPPGRKAEAAAPDYVQRKPTGDMQVMDHRSPLPYKATRFEKYFPPPGENVVQSGLRKAVQALHGKGPSEKTVNLPHGVHLKCKTLLGIPTPMCGLPPAPPPPNDGDERLSMPSAPLAEDPHAQPPPSLETCIAAYRSQGPLPYGCPVDTPARAVDAERRECIALYRAGKRLKTWCPADTARRAGEADASKDAGG